MFPSVFTIKKFGCTCNPWLSFLWNQQRVNVPLNSLQSLRSYSGSKVYVLLWSLKYFWFDIFLLMCSRLLHKTGLRFTSIMCLSFHYLNNDFFSYPIAWLFVLLQECVCVSYRSFVTVFVLPQKCLCLLPQLHDCFCITSEMCVFLSQLRDCVAITSVICLCLLPQLRERVSITPGMC